MRSRTALVFLVTIASGWLSLAASLTTLRNSPLSVPAANVAAGMQGSNFMLSAVAPATSQGGRASLRNSQQWVRRYQGGPGSQSFPYAMAVRADGSIIVTGGSSGPNGGDFATLCYASDGTALWTNRYDGPGHGSDRGRLISVSPLGEVWVAGDSDRYATNSGLWDVAILKYASNGLPLWTNRYTSFETNSADAVGLAVDNAGNAYLEQWAGSIPISGLGQPVEDAIIKYDPAGNVVWTKHYFADAPDSGQDLHSPGPMTVDNAGHLLVAGRSGGAHRNTGISVVEFDGDGTALWTNHHPLQLISGVDLLSLDPQGDAFLTGESFSNSTVSYVVVKISKDGAPLWTNVLPGPIYQGGNVPQTVSDRAGNVFVIGGGPGIVSPGVYQVLKLSSNGIPLWTNQAASFGTAEAMIYGSAVDSAGNLILIGSPLGTNALDFVTVKYSPDGYALWTNRFDGEASLDDIPFAMTVDGAGNVYVTGGSQAATHDFATLKYADLVFYTPAWDFTGLDSITCSLVDTGGDQASGSLDVLVVPGAFGINRSPAVTRLTTTGMLVQVDGIPSAKPVVLQASGDSASWQPILTSAPAGSAVQFLDRAATNMVRRFYRASQEP